jgi:hypothetical protein
MTDTLPLPLPPQVRSGRGRGEKLQLGDGVSGEVCSSPEEALHVSLTDSIPSSITGPPFRPQPPTAAATAHSPATATARGRDRGGKETTPLHIARTIQSQDLHRPKQWSETVFDRFVDQSERRVLQEVDQSGDLIVEQEGTPLVEQHTFSLSCPLRLDLGFSLSDTRNAFIIVFTARVAQNKGEEVIVELASHELEVLTRGERDRERETGRER